MASDMSDEGFGALSFEPWPGEPDLSRFGAASNDHIISTRLAYLTMYKTKDELVAFASDEPELFIKLADNMEDSAEAFEEMVTLTRAARARMLCAASSLLEAAQ